MRIKIYVKSFNEMKESRVCCQENIAVNIKHANLLLKL